MNPTKRRLILSVLGTGLLMFSMATGALGRAESNEQQFRLYGTAGDVVDPQNPDNEAVVFDTTSGEPVIMFRPLKELVVELDNQLEFKYYMANRTCGGGSPRITLGVDNNNDGSADFFLHGHVVPDTGCPIQNNWVYQDLTDEGPRWEVTGLSPNPLRAYPYNPWSAVEQAFGELPVVFGLLVEDSQAFVPTNRGQAFYDLVTIGNHTYTDHSDAARCENRSCLPPESEASLFPALP